MQTQLSGHAGFEPTTLWSNDQGPNAYQIRPTAWGDVVVYQFEEPIKLYSIFLKILCGNLQALKISQRLLWPWKTLDQGQPSAIPCLPLRWCSCVPNLKSPALFFLKISCRNLTGNLWQTDRSRKRPNLNQYISPERGDKIDNIKIYKSLKRSAGSVLLWTRMVNFYIIVDS